MESNQGETVSDLISRLKKTGYEFNFFQAIALLEEYFGKQDPNLDPLHSGKILFSSNTSTAFPPSDIAVVKQEEHGTIHFFLSFMGLLGISSPLPHYFTEYGTFHEGEGSALADFLSIFEHRIYTLFYLAWKKYRLMNLLPSKRRFNLFDSIGLLTGLNKKKFYHHPELVGFAGILAGSCRSAEGLRTILSHCFNNLPVAINQWIPRWAKVKDLKSIGTDAILGTNAMIGTHIRDLSSKFRIVLGPLEKEVFETFLPDQPNILHLCDIVKTYMTDMLEFDIEVKLKSTDLIPVILGRDNAQLGITSACGKSSQSTEAYTVLIEP